MKDPHGNKFGPKLHIIVHVLDLPIEQTAKFSQLEPVAAFHRQTYPSKFPPIQGSESFTISGISASSPEESRLKRDFRSVAAESVNNNRLSVNYRHSSLPSTPQYKHDVVYDNNISSYHVASTVVPGDDYAYLAETPEDITISPNP